MKAQKIIVGLTGNFGTGKSTVSKIFRSLGACVIDADRIAHRALEPQSEVYPKIKRLFGKRGLSRKQIAEIIFRDAAKRKKLEAIVHPYVFSQMVSEMAEVREPVIVLEVPLLYETGFDQFCGITVVVKTPEADAARRLAAGGVSGDEVRRRWDAQMSQEGKISRASFVIDNSGTLEKTEQEVQSVWQKILPAHKGESKNGKRKNSQS